ncbi:MAG: adenosylcobinamide-GDP ribazoletransferase [Deltaproteobacteria bacterium]|nr:adenosylcobinamide-GDP ribazoletransferase [Deltaproteobacteria bacterium]
MNGLRGALDFFTILPGCGGVGWQGAKMLPWFPVVGLILGVIYALADALLGLIFPPALQAALVVLMMTVLTGGLHLDGLADTADGLLSHRTREDALRIMKDSRIGVWGVLALIFVLGLKTLALAQVMVGPRYLILILVPAYGRLAMLAGIGVLPYGRGEEGLAHSIFGDSERIPFSPGGLGVLAGSLVLGWPGALFINVTFFATLIFILFWYRHRLGAITGDMLGALGEIIEAVLLVALAFK